MNRIIAAFCIFTACTVGSQAALNGWGLHAAWWDTKDLDDQLGVGAKIDIEMIPKVALDVRTAYFDGFSDDGDDNLKIVPLETGLNLYQPVAGNLEAFGGGGIGYYFMDGEGALDADSGVGFFLNLGIELMTRPDKSVVYGASTLGFFAEFIYRFLDADVPGDDLSLDGPGFNAGMMIRW